MESNKYQLREAISGDELTAWFEKVDEKDGSKKEVFIKLSKAFHEADEWLEELDISKGFTEEECLDEQEEIEDTMSKFGVEYTHRDSKYPLPPQKEAEAWQKKLRKPSPSSLRRKRKN